MGVAVNHITSRKHPVVNLVKSFMRNNLVSGATQERRDEVINRAELANKGKSKGLSELASVKEDAAKESRVRSNRKGQYKTTMARNWRSGKKTRLECHETRSSVQNCFKSSTVWSSASPAPSLGDCAIWAMSKRGAIICNGGQWKLGSIGELHYQTPGLRNCVAVIKDVFAIKSTSSEGVSKEVIVLKVQPFKITSVANGIFIVSKPKSAQRLEKRYVLFTAFTFLVALLPHWDKKNKLEKCSLRINANTREATAMEQEKPKRW